VAEHDAIPFCFPAGAGPTAADVWGATVSFGGYRGPKSLPGPVVGSCPDPKAAWWLVWLGLGSVAGSGCEVEPCWGRAVHSRGHGAALVGMLSDPFPGCTTKNPSTANALRLARPCRPSAATPDFPTPSRIPAQRPAGSRAAGRRAARRASALQGRSQAVSKGSVDIMVTTGVKLD